jgi:copper resistance protein B
VSRGLTRPQGFRGLLFGGIALLGWSLAFGQELPEHAAHQGQGSSQDMQPAATPPSADEKDTSSEAHHVPPDPPQHQMQPMPYRDMANMMQMDDTGTVGEVLIDQLEWRNTKGGNAAFWDAQAWYGGDYNKVWLKTEGERAGGATRDARADLLWDRIISRWWNLQAGARQDFGQGPSRTWAALGVEGLAPYWFNVEATLYVGEEGRTAARLKSEYDLLLTQRLILQPQAEANLYGKSDPARQIGSGLSDLEVGLRLRYEIRREFAPYVGLAWDRRFGRSADLARAAGEDPNDVQVLAGVRVLF